MNDEILKAFNRESDELTVKSKTLKSLIFNDKLIKFLSSIKEINIFELRNLNGYKLKSGDGDGLLKIWKIESGECLKTINSHTSFVNDFEILSNDMFISC